MSDPVLIDLNRYLTQQEDAIDEEEAAEEELYRDRIRTAMRILLDNTDDTIKARRLVAWVEEEIEEFASENY